MSEMLERVARAIDPGAFMPMSCHVSVATREAAIRAAVDRARAAIEAMRRQPLDTSPVGPAMGLAMERAGMRDISIGAIWDVWDAMLDATLVAGGDTEIVGTASTPAELRDFFGGLRADVEALNAETAPTT